MACVAGAPLLAGQAAGPAVAWAAWAGAALLGALYVRRAFAGPVVAVSEAVKGFITADFKLDSPVPRTGCRETAQLISSLNRLMLELSAYRAFQLNSVLEERSKAQALIETITDGVALADDSGAVIYANRRAASLLGLPPSGASLLGGTLRPEFTRSVRDLFASTEEMFRGEVTLSMEEQDYSSARVYLVLGRRFDLATLKRPGRVIVLRDITMEKEIESSRETFFHMITHDMRAPLTSIQGYAQMLDKKIGDPLTDSGKYLQAIMRSSHRLNGMIEDILSTIKLERGEMRLSPSRIEASELCSEVFDTYDPMAARKNIALKLRVAKGQVFEGDRALLERVLSNLVGNAVKFTPAGGTITIAAEPGNGKFLLSVSDSGPGVPKDRQKEIFEKYAQLEEHRFMGFGLGLAMCKMAAELHGGEILLESEPGRGSVFTVSLPVVPEKDHG